MKTGSAKLPISCVLFMLAMSVSASVYVQSSQGAEGVTVSAQGSAPISQGIIAAKQVALILAKRQAVEKATGMSIEVENTQDQRTVVEKAMAGMTYTIVSEQTSGGMYTVVIHAVVNVPASQAGAVQSAGLSVTPSASQSPFIEKTPYGEINWTDGYIIAYGKGKITKGLNEDICNAMAKRAAMLDAHARVLEMIQNVNLDGDTTIKGFVSKDSKLFYRLKGLIARVEPFEENKENGFYNVKIKIPFYGAKGVQAVFLNAYLRSTITKTGTAASDKRIVIDARGTGLKPSMFVKIMDDKNKDVYTAKDVDRAMLKSKGMVEYVTSTTLQSGDVEAKTLKAEGKQDGNIVVSSSDADRIKQAGNDSALSNGNVVVITDSPVGGTEGSVPFWYAAVN